MLKITELVPTIDKLNDEAKHDDSICAYHVHNVNENIINEYCAETEWQLNDDSISAYHVHVIY